MKKFGRIAGGIIVLVAVLLAIPPLVDLARSRLGYAKPVTWNDVAKRLADFQKEQPGLPPAARIEPPAGTATPSQLHRSKTVCIAIKESSIHPIFF